MNKKANRKAFFILVCIGLMYISMVFNLTEKFAMKRTLDGHAAVPQNLNVAIPAIGEASGNPVRNLPSERTVIEPSLFIAIPIVLSAIKEGLIEKEGLILIKGETNARADFKKPFDILRDKDEDGLVSIAGIIGKKQLLHLLKKDGISIKDDLELSDIILGKEYTIEKKSLLASFDNHVTDEYKDLFPFVSNGFEIAKTSKGFEIVETRGRAKINSQPAETEWVMPNLINLPMKGALEKVSMMTSKIKLVGSGIVTDQQPKPYEKVRGDIDCTIYGRSGKQ
ncbi:MAG: hypothetical protein C0399_01900 [Syntrophus sp. (in: bacteria)]|nr:hypothetical protein [Syntrophus sp. (in: bacteria)]